jgi:hypothetical protein
MTQGTTKTQHKKIINIQNSQVEEGEEEEEKKKRNVIPGSVSDYRCLNSLKQTCLKIIY